MSKRKTQIFLLLALIGITLIFAVTTTYAKDKKVVIAEFNWSSAIITSNMMSYVLENKLNIPTEIVTVTQSMSWPAMTKGTVDVKPECWWPNDDGFFKKYVKSFGGNDDVRLNLIIEGGTQGVAIPTYIAQKYNITDYKGLAKHANIFDMNGDGKGDFWAGGYGWTSSHIAMIQLRDLGVSIDGYMADSWIFNAQLKEAIRKKEPICFYFYMPDWPAAVYDITAIKMPEYDPAKWNYIQKEGGAPDFEKSRITCGWQPLKIYVGISNHLEKKNPRAYQFLKNYRLPIEEQNKMIATLENTPDSPATPIDKVVKDWVESHPEIVNEWVKGIK